MADPQYVTMPAIFQSKGVAARYSDDTLPQGTYLNMNNVEELEENVMASRLGSIIINKTGTTINALGGAVHSLSRLVNPTSSSTWRYAGASTLLYRRAGDTAGAYTQIASNLSGNPWSAVVYRPELSSYPYIYFADSSQMLKDNGSLTAPQQQGIFQPNTPVQALALAPELIVLDNFESAPSSYTISNVSSTASDTRVSTTLSAAITTTGVQKATVASMTDIAQFQLLTIGGTEVVLVLSIPYDNSGFYADFTLTHASGATVVEKYLFGTVAASTTATITKTGSFDLSSFPNGTNSEGADYIAVYLFIEYPANIEQIRVLMDVGDGTFANDYYYKLVLPSIYQDSITQTTDATDLITQIIYDEAIGVYTSGAASGKQLSSGNNQWTKILVQLSDVQTVGNAGLYNPGYTQADINSIRIEFVTNDSGSTNVGVDGFICFGGYGPDSFAGVSYDWAYTYYNENTGTESNPSMLMSNPEPPKVTTWITPRRQPVQLTLVPSTDSQVTHIRIYRQGGTLAEHFLRVAQVVASTTTFIDIYSDSQVESASIMSLTNDVPVTSTLPIPVNTTLSTALTPTGNGELLTITPVSITNISIHQQVTLGADTDYYQEVVIVETVSTSTFTAFVQNAHAAGDPVTAEAVYGQPCNISAIAFNQQWLAGDPNNPQYLYYSNAFQPETFSSAGYIEIGKPDDPIITIIPFLGSLYVATRSTWYGIAPSLQSGQQPTVYPTTAVHGASGSHGWVATETEIWHQSVDGWRTFAGGSSVYRTQEVEFLFQPHVTGETPIEEANPDDFALTTMAYWNNIVFGAYTGADGNRYRLMYHTVYKRFRNDSVPATCMFVEKDTNALLYGDSNGIIHQDRVGTYDEGGTTTVVDEPIAGNLLTAYMDQGSPKNQKNYNEFTIDANTYGQNVTATLLFNDGQITLPLGTFNTSTRQKVNFNLNNGDGQQAYRVAMQLTWSATSTILLNQAALRGVVLAETRQSFDTYFLRFGTDESKLMKQLYIEYNSTAALTAELYYDQEQTPGFTFTLPIATYRTSTRVRLPAVKFRIARLVVTSTADFQIWQDSFFEVKPITTGKSYVKSLMAP